jgi:hypothetical protein
MPERRAIPPALRHCDQFVVLPVLVRGLTGLEASLGASLRTLPQGSADVLASGIFLNESL